MKKHMKNTLFAGLAMLAVGTAQASPIAGLINTGAGITVDKATDFNYTLTDALGAPIYGGYGEAAVGAGWPISPWVADNSSSHWLAPTTIRAQTYDPSTDGIYKWTLAFDLTGYSAGTAALSGRFSADNNAVAYLNGNSIGSAAGFTQWYNFAAASDLFISGINKLEFVVTNFKLSSGNPTGLRVEFIDSNAAPVPVFANVSAVPVPGAVWLFMSGVFGLLAVKRKSTAV
jgi:hypothetical protein